MVNLQLNMTCICSYTEYLDNVCFKSDPTNLESELAESRATLLPTDGNES